MLIMEDNWKLRRNCQAMEQEAKYGNVTRQDEKVKKDTVIKSGWNWRENWGRNETEKESTALENKHQKKTEK